MIQPAADPVPRIGLAADPAPECRIRRLVPLNAVCLATADRCMLPPGHPGDHAVWWKDDDA